ncbi:MAG: Ig-like domain-containing protein [Limisphaerales bacterium]
MSKIPRLSALAFAAVSVAASGGTFTSDFSNPNQAGFTLVGGVRPDGVTEYPAIENGHLALTYNENSQQATITIDDLDEGASIEAFKIQFKLQIGPGSANAADGFSVSFGPDITSGASIGEEGLGTGVIVVFDIYDNGGVEAPAIDVKYGDVVVGHTLFTKAEMVTSQFEDVVIEVTRSGALNLTWKGQAVYRNLILPDYAPVYGQFALGARTGGENANLWVDDLTITTTREGATAPPSIKTQPQSVTVAERGTATFSVDFDGSAPLAFKWTRNGSTIADATGPVLTLDRIPFADNGAKIRCEITNGAGTAATSEATLTVTPDAVAPTLASVEGSADFTHVTVTFSEPVDESSAERTANYSIAGLTISAAVRGDAPNDDRVVLTTSRQTEGAAYTIVVEGVKDTATQGNTLAAGTTGSFSAFALVRGGAKFEAFLGIETTSVQSLIDSEKYQNNQPDIVGYVTEFSSRQIFTDASHENYGGRISAWIVPAETGNYEFFIRSDDASQLYLSTDDKVENAQIIAEETGCCGAFEEPGAPETSLPQPLVAGRKYAIYALWKEGGGGDYCDVAWRKEGSADVPRALPYISGSVLETYAQPTTFVLPVVSIGSPADGATFETGVPVTFTAAATTAAGKQIVRVEFLELGRVVATATESPYTVTLSGLSEGPHQILARAVDTAGISASSEPIQVNVGKQFLELYFAKIDDETTWRYDRSGSDLGTEWREKAFNDGAWPQGKALIADETTTTVEPIRTPISRLNDSGEYVKTFYFRRKFNFDFEVNSGVKLQLRHVVDDGVVIYLNGREIHRLGITADPVDYLSDAAGHENIWEGPYDVPSSFLVPGENILAAEVHQAGGSSSDMVFGAELKAVIPMVPKQLDVVKIDAATNWRYDRSAADLGTEWREKAYNDSAWPQGPALIADETTTTVEPIRTPISRLNDSGEYVKTFYFRTRFNLPIASTSGAKLKLRHVVDDGAIFYLNGQEIHRFGVTADPVDYLSDAAGHENAWEGPYDIPITALLPGENVLAAELHQAGGSSSDMVFGAELVAIVLAQDLGGGGPATPEFVRVAREGGDLVLEYKDGVLQSAPVVGGPYQDVPGAGATSHRVSTTSAGAGYYRLRSN